MPTPAKRVAKLETSTFLVICLDGPETGPLRNEHLEGHLIHIENNNDRYRVAGPMRKDADSDIIGSFFLIEASDEEDAREMMSGDPYISSNMYASVTYNHIMPACGQWMGGVTWDREEVMANVKKYV